MAHLQWRVGDITITRLVEMAGTGPMGGEHSPLPKATPEEILKIDWMRPHFATDEGHVHFSLHALLIDAPAGRLIVDTCVGNDKTRAAPMFNKLTTSFLTDLEAFGWARESVDGVLCTHLHIDHVGWNTMLEGDRWVPTFPKAQYYMARKEFDHWNAEIHGEATEAPETGARALMDSRATFLDSVQPIIDAGLETLVDVDAQIMPGIRLIPTPGHTPGHVSVLIESNGEQAVITGDIMHNPCQIARLDWAVAFDSDSRQASDTRRSFCKTFANTPTLVIGTHFGGPTAGHILESDGAYRLDAYIVA